MQQIVIFAGVQPWNADGWMDVTDGSMVSSVRFGQLANTVYPMDVTPSGISSETSPAPLNKPVASDVRLSGKSISVREEQSANASLPICATESGITTLFSDVHPKNA